MADVHSTVEAVIHLEDVYARAKCVADAISDAAGDAPPSWLLVFQDQLRCLGEAMHPVSCLVRQRD